MLTKLYNIMNNKSISTEANKMADEIWDQIENYEQLHEILARIEKLEEMQ